MANGTVVGIDEAKLWSMADALRNNMDAAEYKHVVLGLIFLKYISDAFEAKHAELEMQRDQGADPEDQDEYRAASIFWVPKEARWAFLRANAPQPNIGTIVASLRIEYSICNNCARNSFSGAIDGRPSLAYIRSNCGDSARRTSSTIVRTTRSG